MDRPGQTIMCVNLVLNITQSLKIALDMFHQAVEDLQSPKQRKGTFGKLLDSTGSLVCSGRVLGAVGGGEEVTRDKEEEGSE